MKLRSAYCFLAWLGLSAAGCSPQSSGATVDFGHPSDLSSGPADAPSQDTDLAGVDLTTPPVQSACGDPDPGCMTRPIGPPQHPFPLQSDPQPDPNQTDNGLDRDGNGWLGLSSTHSNFDFLWLANYADWSSGTVSKINSKKVQEVARYFTVTCFSQPGGSRAACDGTNGCCSRDDNGGFVNRGNNKPSGPHQAVQAKDNHPSRTAVDFNGDVWVANRAFGGQSSVTKIANDMSECTDRNGTPGIQTSSDVNGDGVIDSDCNQDGVPDDLANVQKAPCKNGKAQEFFGLDDECVLFTTNTGTGNKVGRPLALGRGAVDFGPSDAWAGSYSDGQFFRIDGLSGQTKASAKVNGSPYGATVDANGILWAPNLGGGLNYFDTAKPAMAGTARNPVGFGLGGYGVTMDRDNNVWIAGYGGGNAFRYTPDRSNGFAKLGSGYWTVVNNPGGGAGASGAGRGIAADSRTMQSYFVWMARDGGWVSRIDASGIALPNGADKQVDGAGMPAMQVAGGSTIGAGVDTDQNIWGVSLSGSVATRIKVDQNGAMTKPDIAGGQPGMSCPVGAGDRCALKFQSNPDPQPYTYSDFTGFGLRNFTNPKGFYAWAQKGCNQGDTKWVKVNWNAEVPPGTKLTLRARSGNTPIPDNTWGAWSSEFTASPADLKGNPPLLPNPAPYLQIQFDLSTQDKTTTPKLKGFEIVFLCANGIG
ncbi:MAG: hypothetical protein EXR72_08440 [Myxococcales bacterium]|nr:hypothetical protein [Myxococcales bacterium]